MKDLIRSRCAVLPFSRELTHFVLQIRKLEAICNLAGDLACHLRNTSHVQEKVWRMNPPKTRQKGEVLNRDQFEGKWSELQVQSGKFTDDKLRQTESDYDKF